MDHALGVVEGLAVDRQAGMAGRAEQAQQLAQVRVGGHGHDVGAGHHHVLHPDAVEGEHVLEHRPLLGREIRVLDGFCEGVLKVVADGFAGFQAQPGQNPVVPMVACLVCLGERSDRSVATTSIFIHGRGLSARYAAISR